MPQGLKTAGRARCCWWSPSAALHKAKRWISCRIHLRGPVRSKMETGLETSSNMRPKSLQDTRSKVCQGGRCRHRPAVHDTNLNEFPRAISKEFGWKWGWSGLLRLLSALKALTMTKLRMPCDQINSSCQESRQEGPQRLHSMMLVGEKRGSVCAPPVAHGFYPRLVQVCKNQYNRDKIYLHFITK